MQKIWSGPYTEQIDRESRWIIFNVNLQLNLILYRKYEFHRVQNRIVIDDYQVTTKYKLKVSKNLWSISDQIDYFDFGKFIISKIFTSNTRTFDRTDDHIS